MLLPHWDYVIGFLPNLTHSITHFTFFHTFLLISTTSTLF